MEGMLQPTHLFFILLIVLVIFGPGKLPDLGKGLGKGIREFRDGALFMAKGVDPNIGRDVRDVLPDEDAIRRRTWFIYLLAILIGNALYFLSSPFLPAAARLDAGLSSGLPALIDLWLCAFVFGVLSLVSRRQNTRED
jgi:TatA/E family protein of Tat protein translocase